MTGEVIGVFSGLASGMLVATVNYYFTSRRLRNEQAMRLREERLKIIIGLLTQFEDVRTNYERLRDNKPVPANFVVGTETIALTNTLRDLRIYRALISQKFYELLMRRHQAACNMAMVIHADGPAWQGAVQEWDKSGDQLRDAMEAEFYSL